MRKHELYDFIEMKLKAKREELVRARAEMEKEIEKVLGKEISGLDSIGSAFSRLTEVLEKAKEVHSESFDWFLTDQVREAHKLISFKKNLVGRIFDKTVQAYLVYDRDAELQTLKNKYPDTLNAIQKVRGKYLEANRDINSSERLETELKAVIKSSRSAKEAYKNLIALGVDMSDFEESSANLPAVQKLSVDVCLINGNC